MRSLDSCRCWRCTLCSRKVRNKFLVYFWNSIILLCIPCIVATNLNVAWIHVTGFKRFVSRSTHCWKHVVKRVWFAMCGNAVLHWLLVVVLLLLLLLLPHLIVVLEYCLRVLMFWRPSFEGTYLVFLQGQAIFFFALKIEVLCSFEIFETVYQSRRRTSQKTWILNIFLCTLSIKTLVPSKLRIGLRLVRQCQKALNAISTRHTVGLYWVPGHAGVRGNEIADKLARDGSDLSLSWWSLGRV